MSANKVQEGRHVKRIWEKLGLKQDSLANKTGPGQQQIVFPEKTVDKKWQATQVADI